MNSCLYGPGETYKVVYTLPPLQQSNGMRGVAFVEADSQSRAVYAFKEQYKGQFCTVESCEKVFD